MEQSNLLKFVAKGASVPVNTGIRTYPHLTYGVSRQSPNHFQNTHTIVAHNTYHYQHEHAPQFEYHSQKQSIKLHHALSIELKAPAETRTPHNPYKFHLKKGRLGQFIDKNGWMNTVYTMTGHERSSKAREFSNKERSFRLSKIKEKELYESQFIPKPIIDRTYYKKLEEIMSEKVRIRARRVKQAQKHISQAQKMFSQTKHRLIEKQSVSNKMANTTSEWYKGGNSGRKRQLSLRQGQMSRPLIDIEQGQVQSKFLKTHIAWQRNSKLEIHTQNQQQL